MFVGFRDVLHAIGQIGHVDAQDASGHDTSLLSVLFLV
jgi:hypothetical protein